MALFDPSAFLLVFIQLFAIMNPFVSIPVFLSLTKEQTEEEKLMSARKAILAAALPILVFGFTGLALFELLGVTMSDFRVAGGIVLLILGIENSLDLKFATKNPTDKSASAVLIGVPLITGPGVISITIDSVSQYGIFTALMAAAASLLVTYFLLRKSHFIQQHLGITVISVVSRFMALITTTIAIALIARGFGEITSSGMHDLFNTLAQK